ncbi:ABC transporter permease [Pectobacterium actinidiae]|uniref:ABC transporter permease n=1 Tax=Pectobacterium actinidiae TaxID=1507808 RepID=UPI00381EE542
MFEFIDLIGTGPDGWGGALLKGMLVTLEISIGAFVVGLGIGLLTALAKLNGGRVTVALARGYTTVCRAVPELLLILLLYYGGSMALNRLLEALGYAGVNVSGTPVAILVLGLVQGAYASEVFRGAIQAVPHGLIEAAQAFGMQKRRLFIRITLPVMAPHAMAGLANLWISLIKDSALISVVGTNELLYTAKQAGGSTRSFLTFFIAAGVLYYLITLVSNIFLGRLERRLRRWSVSH